MEEEMFITEFVWHSSTAAEEHHKDHGYLNKLSS